MLRKAILLIVGTFYLIVGLGSVLVSMPALEGRTVHQALVHGASGWIELVAMWSICPLIIFASLACLCATIFLPTWAEPDGPPRL